MKAAFLFAPRTAKQAISISEANNMASPNNSIKIHDRCLVSPPPSANQFSLPLTFFDLLWLRFHPVERIFFYSLPLPHSHPSSFFHKVLPKLKTSLSLTLQHFLPLAGNIVWPNESQIPIIQYSPGDGVSLIILESDADFNHFLDNSPHEAVESRSLVPHLESSNSSAAVISLQITLFPNSGFSIGISTHHAVLDGKSSTMFIKAWASLCQSDEESPPLVPELEPFFDREVIKDPNGLGLLYINNWIEFSSKLDPTDDNSNGRSLKILPFQPNLEDSVRATFELTRGDLEKIKKKVLSMWDMVNGAESIPSSKPSTLSSFVLTCAYMLVCVAKAIQGVEKHRDRFAFSLIVDCRARLEPPTPDNYFGNCVWGHFAEAQPRDFTKEDGVVIVAKGIHNKIKMLDKGEGALQGAKSGFSRFNSLLSEGVEIMGVAGSNRFGVYEIDFGWGRPSKVEIASVDRALTLGLAESKDGCGGFEVGLALNKHVMDLFDTIFHAGL